MIVDPPTEWVEAHPLTTAMAGSVIKVLVEQVIPRFGLMENVDSDSWSHSTWEALQDTVGRPDPLQPPSFGKVEK